MAELTQDQQFRFVHQWNQRNREMLKIEEVLRTLVTSDAEFKKIENHISELRSLEAKAQVGVETAEEALKAIKADNQQLIRDGELAAKQHAEDATAGIASTIKELADRHARLVNLNESVTERQAHLDGLESDIKRSQTTLDGIKSEVKTRKAKVLEYWQEQAQLED